MKKTSLIIGLLIVLLTVTIFARGKRHHTRAPKKQVKKSGLLVQVKENHIVFEGKSEKLFKKAFQALKELDSTKTNQFKIYHFGDSHIQADFFPDVLRKSFQKQFPGLNGGRGFLFPYKIAKSYQPKNYEVTYTGDWEHLSNLKSTGGADLGVAGMSVSTESKEASIAIFLEPDLAVHYTFNKIKIVSPLLKNGYALSLDSSVAHIVMPDDSSTTEIFYKSYMTNVTLSFHKIADWGRLTVFGLIPETDSAGVIYSSTGVIGASVHSFLQCNLLPQQLNMMQPDIIIISLGTNDAAGKNFYTSPFISAYNELLSGIRKALPDVAILLTTPGDSNRKRRRANPGNGKAKESIFAIAEANDAAVWDFYSIMGGYKSIAKWFTSGLSTKDRVHLTKKGYELQGSLLYQALLESYERLKY